MVLTEEYLVKDRYVKFTFIFCVLSWGNPMNIARNMRTKKLEYASSSIYDYGQYVCERCGGRVILILPKRNTPHFKHCKGEADPDCEYYAFVIANEGYAASFGLKEEGLDLYLKESNKMWQLVLYLPEFNNDDIESIGLDKIFDINFMVDNKSLVKAEHLWPGNNGCLCDVAPHEARYNVACNKDDIDIDTNRWIQGAEGIASGGVFFCGAINGGKRIPFGRGIELESIVYLITKVNTLKINVDDWPNDIEYEELHQNNNWCAWKVYLPKTESWELKSWLMKFGYRIAKNDYKLKLLWPIPSNFTPDGVLVIYNNTLFLSLMTSNYERIIAIQHEHKDKKSLYYINGLGKGEVKLLELKSLDLGVHNFYIKTDLLLTIKVENPPVALKDDKYASLNIIDSQKKSRISYFLQDDSEIKLKSAYHGCSIDNAIIEIIGPAELKLEIYNEKDYIIRSIREYRLPFRVNDFSQLLNLEEADALVFNLKGFGHFRLVLNELCESNKSIDKMVVLKAIYDIKKFIYFRGELISVEVYSLVLRLEKIALKNVKSEKELRILLKVLEEVKQQRKVSYELYLALQRIYISFISLGEDI